MSKRAHLEASTLECAVNVYRSLQRLKEEKTLSPTVNIENFVSDNFNIGRSTIRRHCARAAASESVVDYCNSQGNRTNHPQKFVLTNEAITSIREFVSERASRGQATTLDALMGKMSSTGYQIGSKMTLRRCLKRAGWCWLKNPKTFRSLGEKMSLKTQRQAFGRQFLELAKTSNRYLLVFSDESHCHRHHARS